MKDLHKLGLRGRLPNFVKEFLTDRLFQVKIDATLSDYQKQEEGVPQGSVLSHTLFKIKINDIIKNIKLGINCSLYVDDFTIYYRSRNLNTAERQLQQCLHQINKWILENGFKISKTKSVHFCQLKKLHNNPTLKLENEEMPVVQQHKFLGIIFDNKLTFRPHINHLKTMF